MLNDLWFFLASVGNNSQNRPEKASQLWKIRFSTTIAKKCDGLLTTLEKE